MSIHSDNWKIPELIATANRTGITFALEEHGKLQMNEGVSRPGRWFTPERHRLPRPGSPRVSGTG
jgi:hypothetical protein